MEVQRQSTHNEALTEVIAGFYTAIYFFFNFVDVLTQLTGLGVSQYYNIIKILFESTLS